MLRRICTKCGRIYDGGVLECDRCHLFLRDYEDSAPDAGFYAGQPSAMPEQQPIDKTIGMQPGARVLPSAGRAAPAGGRDGCVGAAARGGLRRGG